MYRPRPPAKSPVWPGFPKSIRKAFERASAYRGAADVLLLEMDTSMDLALLGNRALQVAVRRNLVCFPSQVPIFGKRPRRDVQWRLAVLYFIRGWSTREIARRYGLTRERCGQIISDWRIRAVNMGYIQDVTPEDGDPLILAAVHTDAPAEFELAECGD